MGKTNNYSHFLQNFNFPCKNYFNSTGKCPKFGKGFRTQATLNLDKVPPIPLYPPIGCCRASMVVSVSKASFWIKYIEIKNVFIHAQYTQV